MSGEDCVIRKWQRLALWGWACVALFLLLELGTRFWALHVNPAAYFPLASRYQLRDYYERNGLLRQKPTRYLGFFPQPNYDSCGYQHNALGFRGAAFPLSKAPGEFRIACVGGSTTYGSGILDGSKTYPAYLEAILRARGYRVTVINAGNEAYTSYETLINYAFRLSYLDLDLLIDYDALNDLLARLVWPPEAYKSDNSGFRSPAGSQHDLPSLLDFSYFLTLALTSIGVLDGNLELFRTYDIWSPTAHALDPAFIADDEKMATALSQNAPEHFARNLEHLVRMAEADRVRTLFLTFVHTTEYPQDNLLGILSGAKNMQPGYAEMNAAIQSVAAKTGSPCFDLASAFPSGLEYYVDGVHFNDKGAQLQAQLIADYLCASKLLPAPQR